jgi:hypothetical protein
MDEYLSKEDLTALSLDVQERDPSEPIMDEKIPTLASFEMHAFHSCLQVGNEHPQTDVQIPHQHTPMDDLLDQFDYLGAIVA